MTIAMHDVITKGDGHIEADIGSEILIMRVESGKYFSMDGVAQKIWAAIDGLTQVRSIITQQLEAYNVDRQVAEAETLAFLNDLLEQKLIERVEDVSA